MYIRKTKHISQLWLNRTYRDPARKTFGGLGRGRSSGRLCRLLDYKGARHDERLQIVEEFVEQGELRF